MYIFTDSFEEDGEISGLGVLMKYMPTSNCLTGGLFTTEVSDAAVEVSKSFIT